MEKKKVNWFIRIMILALSLFISAIIASNFFVHGKSGEISGGLVTLILILVVLVLSEAFDSFSIGKLFTMNRKLDEKKQEVSEVKEENRSLRAELISLSASFTNTQSTMNVVGNFPREFYDQLIQSATPEEVEVEKSTDEAMEEPSEKEAKKRIHFSKMEDYVFEHHIITSENVEGCKDTLQRNVKLMEQFMNTDPISNINPFFDGYIRTSGTERFFEIKTAPNAITSSFRDRLYVMLSRVYHYSRIKNVRAKLVVYVVSVDTEGSIGNNGYKDKLYEWFMPAIRNGLMEIADVHIAEAEMSEKGLYR